MPQMSIAPEVFAFVVVNPGNGLMSTRIPNAHPNKLVPASAERDDPEMSANFRDFGNRFCRILILPSVVLQWLRYAEKQECV